MKLRETTVEKSISTILRKGTYPGMVGVFCGNDEGDGELSEVFGRNKEKAQIIGILHDAGKDLHME